MHALLLHARRSPLTIFIVLGLVLFGIDRLIQGVSEPYADDQYTIHVSSAQQLALSQAFQAEHGRPPNPEELQAKLAFWLDEQMLYREAMALNLDRSDTIVRRQLAQKMRLLLTQRTATTSVSNEDLQQWLDKHPQRYGTPAAIDFEQVFLSRGKQGQALPAVAGKIHAELLAHPTDWQRLSDPFVSGLSFHHASLVSLRNDFGRDFAQAVFAITEAGWQGPIASNLGLHFVRVIGRSAFQPVQLDDVREQVLTDYRQEQQRLATDKALNEIKARYRIHFDAVES